MDANKERRNPLLHIIVSHSKSLYPSKSKRAPDPDFQRHRPNDRPKKSGCCQQLRWPEDFNQTRRGDPRTSQAPGLSPPNDRTFEKERSLSDSSIFEPTQGGGSLAEQDRAVFIATARPGIGTGTREEEEGKREKSGDGCTLSWPGLTKHMHMHMYVRD